MPVSVIKIVVLKWNTQLSFIPKTVQRKNWSAKTSTPLRFSVSSCEMRVPHIQLLPFNVWFDQDFPNWERIKPEDNWSWIAHLSAEDMLKSAVIEEKKFKHSPWAWADNHLGPKFWCQQEGLITMVICCKFKKNLFNLWLYTHLFMI